MIEDLQKRIEKLPKWARDHIKEVTLERNAAQRALTQLEDEQTESSIYTQGSVCDGRRGRGPSIVKRYVQAYSIYVNHGGVELHASCTDEGIVLRNDDGEMTIVPRAHNSILLRSKHCQLTRRSLD